MDFINKIFRGDRVIWMVFLFLCLISIVEVYSASSRLTFRTDYWKPILHHSAFLLAGVGVILIVHAIPSRFFSIVGIVLPVALLLLISARILGEPINGSYRWTKFFGIPFQPAEIAKLCLIVFVAFVLSKRKNTASDTSFGWIVGAAAVTCLIIIFVNGSGSTGLILFGIVYLMLFIGQISLKKILQLTLALLALGILSAVIVWAVPDDSLRKYAPRAKVWEDRFAEFFSGKNDSTKNEGRPITMKEYLALLQEEHAAIAIAEGGVLFFGKMPGNSDERDFLPNAYDDFIYAIIVEEMGLIGGLGVLLLYIILFIRAGIIANRSEKLFPKFLVMGAALILVTQALANMAVAVRLIPVTGQTLPLVSRGGTSILTTCVYIGIILSVSRFENPQGTKREEAIIEEYIEDEKTAENNH
jgi:cell division protein FtsW